MRKSTFVMFLAALMIFGVSGAAFAETQNVKVSGSLDAYAFYRDNFDLLDGNDAGTTLVPTAVQSPSHPAPNTGGTTQRSEADSYFMSITQVQVSADLTDKVSTVINIINMRDWNSNASTAAEFDMDLDLAYVQMKEIFYTPLTLTIGRQDLLFGRGFIVGWNPQDPNSTIQADEFTQVQGFDAIRATLDFNPWTLDFVYSKIRENGDNPEDDRDLYIANVNYKFAEYNAVAEGYYIGEFDSSTLSPAVTAAPTISGKDNDTQTVGGRVQFDPISQITLGGELAYQFGTYRAAAINPARDRDAWAADIFGEYRWDNAWKPMAGLEYVYLSGEGDLSSTTSDYGSWNGSFRGPIYGWIHDYLEVYYSTAFGGDQAAGQNQQSINLYGSIKPMEDLKLTASWFYFWATDDYHITPTNPASSTLNESIGNEIDLAAIYSYTEDVTFSVMADWFIPGDLYNSPTDETATQVITEVKVTF